jgi:protein SCO1/2
MNRIHSAVPRIRRQGIIAIASTAILFACTTGNDSASADDYRGRLLSEPRRKADFTLTDTEGREFKFLEQTDGYVTLVFFGYTHCPDVCPIHMANIGAVLNDFPYELRRQYKVIFITTDPERDTPERMREWLDNFDTAFIGLTGTADKVGEISVFLGLPPPVKVETEDGGYAIGHSAHVLAFTKDNLAHILYPFGTRQADWAHDLPKLANESWESR